MSEPPIDYLYVTYSFLYNCVLCCICHVVNYLSLTLSVSVLCVNYTSAQHGNKVVTLIVSPVDAICSLPQVQFFCCRPTS